MMFRLLQEKWKYAGNIGCEYKGRPSTNVRNGSSQTFRPRCSNEMKNSIFKRALNTFADWAKCLKSEGEVEKLPLITEEEYDVVKKIIEIGERVAE
ncbi:hypothetical protein CEXT_190491 [Caerostris extrusa]|uniref:Uncharacterized protein n=1 Tax=Caerostris extrusa TaxID=172846 RepID=A0AAV4NEV4_CAEEX|nr:hypothetical protein CEXT_190491 [Caerostris extrusa]